MTPSHGNPASSHGHGDVNPATTSDLVPTDAALRDRVAALERIQAQAQELGGRLLGRAEQYGTILDMVADGFCLLDKEGRFLDANDAYCRMSGYTRQELLAMVLADVETVDTRGHMAQRLQEVMRTCSARFESRHRRKDGELVDLDISVSLLHRNGGRFSCLLREITGRKEAARTLERRTHQLEAVRAVAEEITRELDLARLLDLIVHRAVALVGAVAGCIYLWNEGDQVLVPQAWTQHGDWITHHRVGLGQGLPGTVAARREGMIVNDYRGWPAASPLVLERSRITASVAEPLLYRERLVGVIVVDTDEGGRRFTEEDRQSLSFLGSHVAIALENARLFAELKRAYDDVSRAQDELVRSEKLRALGQMAAGIAHDLNNILAAILGQTDLLRLRISDPPVHEALTTLELAATDAAEVVRRLQEFSRQQASRPLLPVDLAATVREALEITRPRWKDDPQQRGVVIEARLALGDLPPVLGHAHEIREALTNLILNAVDAMPQGGTLTIAAREIVEPGSRASMSSDPTKSGAPDAALNGRVVELAITDTGVGMTTEVRQRIFDPFFTTKGVKGTGLGLSVVYGIMQRHGGQIDVGSSPGQGTTFTLRFRVAAGALEAPSQSAGDCAMRPRRILLIDDDATVRRTMAELLQEVGHSVVGVEGGAEGLAHLGQNRVDLVITDLGMPGMTGWEVARAVKLVTPHPPVVLLTGWGERPASHSEHADLVDRILGKPVRLDELLAAIRDLTRSTDEPGDLLS